MNIFKKLFLKPLRNLLLKFAKFPDQMKSQVILLVDNDILRLEIIKSILSNKNLVGKQIQIHALEDEELLLATQAVQSVWKKKTDIDQIKSYKDDEGNKEKAKKIALNLKKVLGTGNEGWFDIQRLKRKTRWRKQMCEEVIDNLLIFEYAIKDVEKPGKYKIIFDDEDKITYLNFLKQRLLNQLEEVEKELSTK